MASLMTVPACFEGNKRERENFEIRDAEYLLRVALDAVAHD